MRCQIFLRKTTSPCWNVQHEDLKQVFAFKSFYPNKSWGKMIILHKISASMEVLFIRFNFSRNNILEITWFHSTFSCKRPKPCKDSRSRLIGMELRKKIRVRDFPRLTKAGVKWLFFTKFRQAWRFFLSGSIFLEITWACKLQCSTHSEFNVLFENSLCLSESLILILRI